MNRTITVICPNNRRVPVKVQPRTTLFEVLDEACKKQGYETRMYGLRTQGGKNMDLSVPSRHSGLPNNCTLETYPLELTSKGDGGMEQQVPVALQLQTGERLMDNFSTHSTLYELVEHFERSKQTSFFDRGASNEQTPVIQYLQDEVVGVLSLENTTLLQLGVTSKALLRFSVRDVPEETLSRINESVILKLAKDAKLKAVFDKKSEERLSSEASFQVDTKEIDATSVASVEPPSSPQVQIETEMEVDVPAAEMEPEVQPGPGVRGHTSRLEELQDMLSRVNQSIDNDTELPVLDLPTNSQAFVRAVNALPDFVDFKFPEETRGLDLTGIQGSSGVNRSQQVLGCDRQAVVFKREENAAAVELEPSQEFFEVSVHDIQVMQQQLAAERVQLENRALLPDKFVRAQNEIRKRNAWLYTVVRITFPDRHILQGTFRSMEPIVAVYDFVRKFLKIRDLSFNLVLLPNVVINKMDQSLLDAQLSPAVTLQLRLSGQPISDDLINFTVVESVTETQADTIAKLSLQENKPFVLFESSLTSVTSATTNASSSGTQGSVKSPPPKWLKLGTGKK